MNDLDMLYEGLKGLNKEVKKMDTIISSAYYDLMKILSDCSKKTQRKVREQMNQVSKEKEELKREIPFEVYSIMFMYLAIEDLLETHKEQKIFARKDEDILLVISAYLELIFKTSISLEEDILRLSNTIF